MQERENSNSPDKEQGVVIFLIDSLEIFESDGFVEEAFVEGQCESVVDELPVEQGQGDEPADKPKERMVVETARRIRDLPAHNELLRIAPKGRCCLAKALGAQMLKKRG